MLVQRKVMVMPRAARQKSESGIYHIMTRGISQSQLFYDDEDRKAFLERLARYKGECGFRVYAWCLMGNHIHLLVREGEAPLSEAMKRMLLSYSHYFNKKYDRRGYLYQDRHKRKPVDGDSYFLAALRYIHRNPLEIGETVRFWTSFDEYMCTPCIVDTSLALAMFSDDLAEARLLFKEFIEDEQAGEDYSLSEGGRMRDASAAEIIKTIANVANCTDVAQMSQDELAAILPALKYRGLSIRQIARLTGLNRGVVQRA